MSWEEYVSYGQVRHIEALIETGRADEAAALIEHILDENPELQDKFREHFEDFN